MIVEDEVLIAEDIRSTLINYGIKEVELAHSFDQAISAIDRFNPSFVLLDIRMEREMDGFNIANLLNDKYKIPFMFVTSHSDEQLVKKIIGTKPWAYVTKPINKPSFFAQIQLVISQLDARQEEGVVMVRDGGTVFTVRIDEILYVVADGNYLNIYTNDDRVNTRMSMAELREKLTDRFVKIHRSYIVNIDKISAYSTTEIQIDDKRLPISRGMKDNFLSVMQGIS